MLGHTETAVYVVLKPISLKSFLCHSTATQLPNYRNSLGMRHNFRLVLLFMEVFKSEGEGENREEEAHFHLPLDTFPSSDLQL